MRRLVLVVALLLCPALAPAKHQVDWDKARAEILTHFTNLLRIDTSNPPGNETAAANYVKAVLEREGIPAKLLALEPGRANLVARLHGDGSRRPILIMGHTDVVGVQREKWTVDPFAAIRKDGFIYGRGAVDDKDNLTACLMMMLFLKRAGIPLSRDVIFVAEAGEESTTRVGIDFLVSKHWNEIDAEFALAEGGGAPMRDGKVRYVSVGTTEKVPRPVRLVAHGNAGHGSRPTPDNPIVRLSTAVARFAAWQPPIRLNDTTRAYFERLATISPAAEAWRYNHVNDAAAIANIDRYFAQNEFGHYSALRTSIVPTILKGGFRSNVIPSEAEATLDVRALPDEDMDKLYAEIRKLINDPKIEVIPPARPGRPAAAPSRLDTPVFRALENAQRAVYPGAITIPMMQNGATDMAQLRAKGVQAYGIGPMTPEGDTRGAHSDDERILEEALIRLVQFMWSVVTEVAAK